jgi:predicted ribosomally synthesized peptide with nif11-like leader
MSWSELERLVSAAETRAEVRRAVRRCTNSQDLITAARALGFRITAADLKSAEVKHRVEHRNRRLRQHQGSTGAA